MGWASFLEDIERVRDELKHLREHMRTTSPASVGEDQTKFAPVETAKRNSNGGTQGPNGLRKTLAITATNLEKLEERLNALLEMATDPAIGIAVEAEKALATAEQTREKTKLIARKALAKSLRRKDAAAALENLIEQLKKENFSLKAELAKLKMSGETNPFERENNTLKSRILQLQEMLGERSRRNRGE
ncbi:MAG: hypothetical protein R3D97_12220 [Paracoccaceae bacterium]